MDKNKSALCVFTIHYTAIQKMLRAADIYTIHALARIQDKNVNINLINQIMDNEHGHSTLVHAWFFHMTEEENNILCEDLHIRTLCEQIVTSTYVAIEHYLVNRFKELISMEVTNPNIVKGILKSNQHTRLEKIAEKYKLFFDVEMLKFDPDIGLFESNWFNPDSCWNALRMLSKVRNEVSHTGSSKTHEIRYLIDAYTPLDFSWDWIQLFDAHLLNNLERKNCQ